MPCPTTPVVPRTTDKLNVAVGTLQETNAPQRPVQHLPKENCLSPTREALPALPAAGNHALTITRSGSCKPFSTIPVVPRRTGEVNVVVAVLKKKSAPPRPVQHLPKENCLGLLRRSLPARNPGRTAPITHGPTRFLWTTPHHCDSSGALAHVSANSTVIDPTAPGGVLASCAAGLDHRIIENSIGLNLEIKRIKMDKFVV